MEYFVSTIPVGTSALRGLNVGLSGTGPGCNKFRWNDVVQGVPVNGDKVRVTRTDVYTWLVESQPAPLNKVYCLDNGLTYNINVRFTIVARTLPR